MLNLLTNFTLPFGLYDSRYCAIGIKPFCTRPFAAAFFAGIQLEAFIFPVGSKLTFLDFFRLILTFFDLF